MFYRVSRPYCFNIQPIIPRKSFRDGYTIHALQPLHATWCAILQRESGPLVFFRAIQTPATQRNHAKYEHYCVQYREKLFQRCMDTQRNLAIACNMRTIYCTVYPGPNQFPIESFERNQNRPNMQNTRSIDHNIAQNDFRDGYTMQSSHCLQHFAKYCTVHPSLLGYWNATKVDQTCQVRAGTYCFNLLLNSNHCTLNQFQKYFYFCTAS